MAAASLVSSPDRYSTVAIWLHWLIAFFVIANLLLGFFHEDFGKAAEPWMMWFHKATGMTVLALTVARIGWRLGHRPPPFDPVMKRWEMGLARFIHILFYVMLIVIPLSGWVLTSTNGRVTSWFGLFEIAPLPVSRDEDFHETMEEVHELLAKAMIGLILLHVAGALKHHFAGHRHLIGRMAPWAYREG